MNLETFMREKGYSEETPDPVYGNDGVVYWYRRVPGTVHHQYVVKMWPPVATRDVTKHSAPSFEVEMSYETRNHVWGQTKYYGLTYTQLVANLTDLEERLKSSLKCLGANPQHYHFDGES